MKQDLVMIGYMGLAGTGKLIDLEKEKIMNRLPSAVVEQVASRYGGMQESVAQLREDWQLTQDEEVYELVWGAADRNPYGIVKIMEAGGDGFLNVLWRLSRRWETGFTIRLKEVPVRQETIEVCEILDVNPYELNSDSCLWIAAEKGYGLCQKLREEGIPAVVIGELTDSKDCLLVHDDTVSYLNRPQPEEYARYLEIHG
jgi:hydrogenase expression/formation protein HypE